jgi:hypothetical protein
MKSLKSTALLLAVLAVAPGCAARQAQEYVVRCNTAGLAQHDFQTTDATTLGRVTGLLMAPRAAVKPVDLRVSGSIATASCTGDVSVAFVLDP